MLVLWLPLERKVGAMSLILLIKPGLCGGGWTFRTPRNRRGTPPQLSIFGLAGGVESKPWTLGCRAGCWTSPGKHDIREGLSRGEEGEDDPVHHPFHLKTPRAVLAGPQGDTQDPVSACRLCWRCGGEGTLRVGRDISTLPVDLTRAGGKEHKGTFGKQGLISAEALVQSHSCLECDPRSSPISALWVGWEMKCHKLTYSFTFFVFTAL